MSNQPTDTESESFEQDPFEGDSNSFEVTRLIDISQLQDEIEARVGQRVQAVLFVDEFDHVASPERPATVFIKPQSLDENVVREVIDAHVAAVPAPPDPEMTALAQKLKDGKTLTTAEISLALKAIMKVTE